MRNPSESPVCSRFYNEAAVLNYLGIPDFRHLSKETFLRFLDALPDVDPDVALRIADHLPEFAALARDALAAMTESLETAIASNDLSRQMVCVVNLKRMEALTAELGKDIGAEERIRVLNDLREVNESELKAHISSSAWLLELMKVKLAVTVVAALGLAAVVVIASGSGSRTRGGSLRFLRS